MDDKLLKICKYGLWGLMGIIIVILAICLFQGETSADLQMYMTYALVILLVLAFLFSPIYGVIVNPGSVKNIAIALGPNLGFFGTVIGMVQAFDSIAAAGDISPTIVAGGMKVALLTTVFGLITAMILQVAYNFILNKIEGILNDMEDSTISFMDILNEYSKKN